MKNYRELKLMRESKTNTQLKCGTFFQNSQ